MYEDLTSDMHSDIKYCSRCAPNTLVPISAMFSWVGTDLMATLFCTCTSSLTKDTSTLTALRALTTRFVAQRSPSISWDRHTALARWRGTGPRRRAALPTLAPGSSVRVVAAGLKMETSPRAGARPRTCAIPCCEWLLAHTRWRPDLTGSRRPLKPCEAQVDGREF